MSEADESDSELDPRIQIELEKLNTTTDEINKLEIEYDEANTTFRMLLNESTRRLKLLTKKFGSCIEKARPYYDLLEVAKRQQKQCQEAAALYQKANGIHSAAKETVALAEQRFLTNQHEWQFDNAWQEMLNHATMKVMEAETQKAERGREHQIKASVYKETEENLKQLEDKLQRFITKSRPYFDEKALCQEQLNTQKQRIESLKKEIIKTKNFYSQTLKNLEQISNEIHMKRKDKYREADLLKRPREPGVGAELNVPYTETPNSSPSKTPKHMCSLPDITAELDKCEICSVATTSSAVSEKDESEDVYVDLEEVKAILKDMNIRPEMAEGKNEDVYISELHIGNLSESTKHDFNERETAVPRQEK
ncbi:SH3 domain-binding protein 5 homolog [Cylas formicarius]|uniref:SH3 domain-binding protein 5 homolog n=1 Tax=Cylas formicarius TaxID=197179 RepID=UPI0029589845|nr:SH3 domain-binding protein 5 homolog [Cylas formicarius]XP_060527762.1 SH3 domain-binding protein 5 homolog [Cylas formicarius]XP_060527763.1 SH3 domain-binding protein 5 homolog [Cylas formicarius]